MLWVCMRKLFSHGYLWHKTRSPFRGGKNQFHMAFDTLGNQESDSVTELQNRVYLTMEIEKLTRTT